MLSFAIGYTRETTLEAFCLWQLSAGVLDVALYECAEQDAQQNTAHRDSNAQCAAWTLVVLMTCHKDHLYQILLTGLQTFMPVPELPRAGYCCQLKLLECIGSSMSCQSLAAVVKLRLLYSKLLFEKQDLPGTYLHSIVVCIPCTLKKGYRRSWSG